MDLKDLIRRIAVDEKDVLNVYQYGSRVYGTNRSNSDWDFIIVLNNKIRDQFSDNQINVTFYTPLEFNEKVVNHEISVLECIFLPDYMVWKEQMRFQFKLDLVKLRHSLSAKSSNSWVKAKKKLTIPADYDLNIGKKSLFHSMRIIHFGIQIATAGSITKYNECNDLFNEIMNTYNDWDSLFDNYKERYNNLMSEFRKVAPKE